MVVHDLRSPTNQVQFLVGQALKRLKEIKLGKIEDQINPPSVTHIDIADQIKPKNQNRVNDQ